MMFFLIILVGASLYSIYFMYYCRYTHVVFTYKDKNYLIFKICMSLILLGIIQLWYYFYGNN